MSKPLNVQLCRILKERGFDVPVILCYDKCDMLSSYASHGLDERNYNTSGYCASAPTAEVVINWLREKYKLSVEVHSEWFKYTVQVIEDTLGANQCRFLKKDNEDYYLAQSMGILEALKLIK